MAEKWQIGGYHTDTLAGKVAKVGWAGKLLNNSGVCFKVSGVDYQVTAGKTLYVTGIYVITCDLITSDAHLRYADNAELTANPVAMGFSAPTNISAGHFPTMIPLFGITAPAGKYVGVFQTTAANAWMGILMVGYEA